MPWAMSENGQPGYDEPIGPWQPRRRQGVIRQIRPEELPGWIVHEDAELLVVNKPGDVVCHPSKEGPWSSLAGAVREYLGGGSAHLVFRLDRETSGLVVLAKHAAMARRLQMAVEARRYAKRYTAILTGVLTSAVEVDRPLGPDVTSPVAVKSAVVAEGTGQAARTQFEPVARAGGFTLVRARTHGGRKHQIRAHAQWLGLPIVGDKIYGPDPRLFLEFVDTGWTAALAERLLLPRQALHCDTIDLRPAGVEWCGEIPLAPDLAAFCHAHGLEAADSERGAEGGAHGRDENLDPGLEREARG